MDFEDQLRHRLRAHADALDLHGRGVAHVAGRARRRHRHRRAAVAAAAVGALVVGGAGIVRLGQGDATTSLSSQGVGLPVAGPLALDWAGAEGGVASVRAWAGDPATGLYALSTAPGVAGGAQGPRAVYRLAGDGTWAATPLGGGSPVAVDLAVEGDLLHAVSTSPATGGAGWAPVLSTSADGGASWVDVALELPPPPSGAVAWRPATSLAVEHVAGATVAVVSTSFSPALDDLVAQLQAEAGGDATVVAEHRADGIAVVAYGHADPVGPDLAARAATEGTAPAGAGPSGSAVDGRGSQVLHLVTWAELGVSDPADLAGGTQVLVRDGDGWTEVDAPLDGLHVGRVQAIGDEVVVTAWPVAGPEGPYGPGGEGVAVALASADGLTWRQVGGLGPWPRLAGLGDAWVEAPGTVGGPGAGPVVRVSTDRGASWQALDLAGADERLAGTGVVDVASGPLGLALVVGDGEGGLSVALTRDLATWVVEPVEALFGAPVTVPSVVVGSDRVVLTASFGGGTEAAPAPSRTLVGTPVAG